MQSEVGRVLILDDEPAIGKSLAAMVRHFDMESKAVESAEDFFNEVRDWKPTHIILDLIMPGKDGIEVLLELATMGCESVIGLSSGLDPRVMKAAQVSGTEHGLVIQHLLPKPMTLKILEDFLSAHPLPVETPLAQLALPHEYNRISGDDLRHALEHDEISLAYQPITSCQTHMLKGFEALARWNHPDKGWIPADYFICLAEHSGLIHQITDRVTEMALAWFSSARHFPDLTLSVNISAKTFSDTSFPDKLEAAARKAFIEPGKVILEVTETAAIEDRRQALDLFTRLRVKGFEVSIDDFGIGNSSLAMLSRLPFSEVKIDKSFGMNAETSDEAKKIIKSTVELGHDLGLRVVAEGVEHGATLNYLAKIGCDHAQGYYIARPMAGDQAVQFMLDRR